MTNGSGTRDHEHTIILQKTARGIFWNFVAYGLSKLIVLLTTSILARLLTKEDFGLVALAVVAVNYLGVIKDLGLGVALVQRRGDIIDAANTVFTLNLIFGMFLSLITLLLAPLVADYFSDSAVTPILRWLGLSFFINSLGSVHVIWLMRELDYSRKLIPDIGSVLIKGFISIGMAVTGWGVWSLVVGQLIGGLSSVVLFWVIVPWRPRFALDSKITLSLLSYGASIMGSDILDVTIDNLGYIIIGRLFGTVQLGVYTLAYRLPELLLIGNLWIMTSVTFPAFANIQEDLHNLRRGFLGSVRLVGLVAMPICLGLIIAADPIIRVIFGNQWLDAIPVLRILSVYAFLASVGYHVGDVYKAIGKPNILLGTTILTVFLMLPSLLIGSRFGLQGIAWGYVIAMWIERMVSLALSTRYIDLTLRDIFSQLIPAFKGGAVMVLILFLPVYLSQDFSPFYRLVLIIFSSAAGYLGYLWCTERQNLSQLVGIIRNR